MKRGLVLIAIDQALLSGSSLLIAAAFVAYGAKSSYSWYTLATSALLLLSSIQNALISTPILTLGPRVSGAERGRLIRRLRGLQLLGVLGLGLMGAAGLLWWSWHLGSPMVFLALSFWVGVAGSWARETRRSVALLEGRAAGVLLGDSLMVLLGIAGFTGGWYVVGQPMAEHALLALGLAGILTSFSCRRAEIVDIPESVDSDLDDDLKAQIRWTLPSVVISWIQSNVYPFVVSGLLSVTAVADLAATRLLIMPSMVITAAWARFRLPAIGESFAIPRPKQARRSAVHLAGLLVPIALMNACAIVGLQWSGLFRLLPQRYHDATHLATWWILYAVVSAFRSALSTCAQARQSFRGLFVLGIIAAVSSLVGIAVFLPSLGPAGAPLSLVLSEAVLSVGLWHSLRHDRVVLEPSGSPRSGDLGAADSCP